MLSTMQDYPLTVSSILRHGTRFHGDKTVSTFTGAGFRTTTYRELGGRVAQLAHALRSLGIDGDQRVATFLWNNQEHLEAYFAVPSIGAVLHTINIRVPRDQIVFIANQAEDQVLIVDMSLAPIIADVLPQLETVHTVVVAGDGELEPFIRSGKKVLRYEELLADRSTEFDWPDVIETDSAAMCYTSGTTGNPKGVAYSHRSTYLHSMAACTVNGLNIGEADRILPVVPMFHANAWGLPYAALMAGADLILPDRFLQAEPLITIIETARPTMAGAVPTIWNDVLHQLDSDPARDISSLRSVACGGSAVPLSLMQTFEAKYGVPILQAWGMTETSPLAAVARPPAGVSGDEAWDLRTTQGRPICGVEARIVDDEGRALPWDSVAVGELEVRGPWITGGYFGTDNASTGDWLRTGDVGRMDARGFITLTDRAKDVIKSGGEWISSVELENHIMGHPAVLEAAVVGVPDEKWQERPLATVVLRPGAQVTIDDLRTFLEDKVVRWWIPERWSIIDQVPRTSVGKFDKKVIRSRYAAGEFDITQG